MTAQQIITDDVRVRIEAAIHAAEQGTSGEIRVHIEDTYRQGWTLFRKAEQSLLDRAAFVFDQLEMNKTQARNGVLLYLSVLDHKAAIMGDIGINMLVDEHYWKDALHLFTRNARELGIEAAIIQTIEHIGEKVKELFPIQPDDVNELPNTITIGHKDINKKR
ncbi:MAG: TPM domain-containing protein [Flavobacteriales bacterium]